MTDPENPDPDLRVFYALVLIALVVTILVLWSFTRMFA
jgi:uncharacterized protein HemY